MVAGAAEWRGRHDGKHATHETAASLLAVHYVTATYGVRSYVS